MIAIKETEAKNIILNGLREKGLKLTPQRYEIIAVLTSDRSHPSALTIFQRARKNHPKISLSTVYSTLALLKKHQLVKELEFETMDNRYDMDTGSHINLICSKCGRIEDFEGAVPVMPEVIKEVIGFRVEDFRLEYYGICKQCDT